MIKKLQEENTDSFEMQFLKTKVDLKQDAARPETLISIGTHTYKGKQYPNDVMTAGEFSVISAPSKTRKSFFKSALEACYIGGNAKYYFSNIKSHRNENFDIISIDTEQSEYYAQRTFRRVPKMTGIDYTNYHPFRLRGLAPTERMAFIDRLLSSGKIKNPKLMFIDGVADLIDDTNDLVMSNEAATYLLKWSEDYNMHICVIIHNAYGTTKPTGHLGSAVTKKAETVFMLSSEDSEDKHSDTIVTPLYTRGMSFEKFKFNVVDGLPISRNDLEDNYGFEDYNKPFESNFDSNEESNDIPF